MILPTAEQVLSKLPIAITLWTAITLCWGVYIHSAFNRMMVYADAYKGGRRKTDVINTWFIMLANASLISFLLLEPIIASYSDAVIVINVFYDAFLIAASITICRWWKSKVEDETKNPPPAP